MRLNQAIVDRILEDRQLRLDLAGVLNFSEYWIKVCATKNELNGKLTTLAALECIEKKTGVPITRQVQRIGIAESKVAS